MGDSTHKRFGRRGHCTVAALVLAWAPAVDADEDRAPCDSYIVEYDLRGDFEVRDTPLNLWNLRKSVGPGRMKIHVDADDKGSVVRLLELQHKLYFKTPDVTTDMQIDVRNPCGAAEGALNQGRIHWSSGIEAYRTTGTVTCTMNPLMCAIGQLPYHQPIRKDDVHQQYLGTLVFRPDGAFEMDWVHVPSDDPGKSFIRFRGKETGRTCAKAPVCK